LLLVLLFLLRRISKGSRHSWISYGAVWRVLWKQIWSVCGVPSRPRTRR
jgi:hypothetical protein